MIRTIKIFFTLFALIGLLAACTSQPQETPPPEPEIVEPEVEEVEPMVSVQTYRDMVAGVDYVVYFDFDESVLKPESRAILLVHAEALKAAPESVRIEGHCDERGTREYNMALGERRANAVRDFLVLQGVDSSLLETVSYGEEQPAMVGSDEVAWAKNRRAEIK